MLPALLRGDASPVDHGLMTDPGMDDEPAVDLPALFDTRAEGDAEPGDDARERAAADLRRVVDAMMD
jgi:hypothetical protein